MALRQQSILAIVLTECNDDYELAEVARPAKKVRPAAANEDEKRAARCCALCAFAKCGEELTCKGKGGRGKCGHKGRHHCELGLEVAMRKRYRGQG